MKSTIRLLAVFLLVLVSFGQYTPASADYKDNDQYWTAHATFESFDSSGCIRTTMYVYVFHIVAINIFVDDLCTGAQLLTVYSFTPLDDVDFQISGNLDSATLNVTVDIYDSVSGSTYPLSVDLTWTAISLSTRSNVSSQFHSPYCHDIYNSHYRYRNAEASGVVSDGQTNFTPESAVSAYLGFEKYTERSGCYAMQLPILSQPIASTAGDLVKFKYSGTYAGFSQIDPSGCIITVLDIWPGRIIYDSGYKLSGAAMGIFSYDLCTQTYLLRAFNDYIPLTGTDFKVSGNSAELKKTATLYDVDRNISLDVFVDLIWTAAGPLNQNVLSFQQHSPICDQHGHETLGWREGQATGTISSAAMDIAAAQADYAEFQWDRYVVDYCH